MNTNWRRVIGATVAAVVMTGGGFGIWQANQTPPAPTAVVAPGTVNFGSQSTGSSAPNQSVLVENPGDAPLTYTPSLSGTNASQFSIVSNPCNGTVPPGGNCTVTVGFSPTQAGALSASLSLSDNAQGSPHIATLSGTGTSSGGPTLTAANLWVDGGTGSCQHSNTQIAYSASTACGSLSAAYTACQDGDLIAVKDGSYGAQTFTSKSTTGWTQGCTFQAETPLGATVQQMVADTGPSMSIGSASWMTFDQMNFLGYQTTCDPYGGATDLTGCDPNFKGGAFADSSSSPSSHVTIENSNIDAPGLSGGPRVVQLDLAQNWTFSGDTFGPLCCGSDHPGSPVAIDIGKPNSTTPTSCSIQACNITIQNNLFQYADLRDPSQWPTSGFGSPPERICTNNTLCHADAIQIFGCSGCNILNNRFYGNACTDIEIQPTNNGLNSNFNIIGNTSTSLATLCNGFISIDCHGANDCGGTFNIGFNSSPTQNLLIGWLGAEPGTVINYYGNYGPLLTEDEATGGTIHTGVGCTDSTFADGTANVTFHYAYNVFRVGGTGTISSPCASSDTVGTGQGWVNTAAAPAVGQDMHLAGSGLATNFVPCASLTVGLGCPIGTDTFGNPWSSTTANAGADQG